MVNANENPARQVRCNLVPGLCAAVHTLKQSVPGAYLATSALFERSQYIRLQDNYQGAVSIHQFCTLICMHLKIMHLTALCDQNCYVFAGSTASGLLIHMCVFEQTAWGEAANLHAAKHYLKVFENSEMKQTERREAGDVHARTLLT